MTAPRRTCETCDYYKDGLCDYFSEELKETKACCHWDNQGIAILEDHHPDIITLVIDGSEYTMTPDEAMEIRDSLDQCIEEIYQGADQ